MALKSATWYPIAVALAVVNLVAAGFALSDPMHAASHVALAVAAGLWAQRLRQRPSGDVNELEARLEELEGDVSALRQELGEANERLDFTERVLAQRPEAKRVDPA